MSKSVDDLLRLKDGFSRIEMLPGMSVWQYLTLCRERHSALYERLNPARVSVEHVASTYASIAELSTHFEGKLEKGRGDSYRKAQNESYLARAIGFLGIFDLAIGERRSEASRLAVLDALGGNGTLTRIVRASRPPEEVPLIVTSDVSGRMIESALAQGLPAIRQPLQDLIWFDDATFDAVIVAYGTHHIPREQRLLAISEARRVLKPGGRIVLQDFEVGSPTTRWYDEVLDRYTTTGHRYDYFTRQDFNDLLVGNDFRDVTVMNAYDPFILHADDREQAWRQLLSYVFTLFALEKLAPEDGEPEERFWERLEGVVRDTSTFDPAELPPGAGGVREPTITREDGRYRAEIPRVSLVATGVRPAASSSPSGP
jgi:SAM-dependent methyltransferase